MSFISYFTGHCEQWKSKVSQVKPKMWSNPQIENQDNFVVSKTVFIVWLLFRNTAYCSMLWNDGNTVTVRLKVWLDYDPLITVTSVSIIKCTHIKHTMLILISVVFQVFHTAPHASVSNMGVKVNRLLSETAVHYTMKNVFLLCCWNRLNWYQLHNNLDTVFELLFVPEAM